MKALGPRLLVGLIFLLGLACTSPSRPVIVGSPETPTIGVFFSPEGGATEVVVSELSNAKQEILVQAYSFTSAPIAKDLVDVHKRGVKVTVVLDKNRRAEKYSSANFVNNAGIPVNLEEHLDHSEKNEGR